MFLRSDELPGRAALGYLSETGLRTNVHHLAIMGSGDGGLFTTAGDITIFWTAFFTGGIVGSRWVSLMTAPRSEASAMRHGLGFWLHANREVVILEGMDAGVSFRSVYEPSSGRSHTVIANTTDGAWAISAALDKLGG